MSEAKEAPKRLWIQITANGGTVSYVLDPREVHDNGRPVYEYALIDAPVVADSVAGERIRSAAVRKAGVVYPCFAHTYNEITRLNLDAPEDVLKYEDSEQGFITSWGDFVDRFEALEIARKAGQIIHEHAPVHGLFSEDLRAAATVANADLPPDCSKCHKAMVYAEDWEQAPPHWWCPDHPGHYVSDGPARAQAVPQPDQKLVEAAALGYVEGVRAEQEGYQRGVEAAAKVLCGACANPEFQPAAPEPDGRLSHYTLDGTGFAWCGASQVRALLPAPQSVKENETK